VQYQVRIIRRAPAPEPNSEHIHKDQENPENKVSNENPADLTDCTPLKQNTENSAKLNEDGLLEDRSETVVTAMELSPVHANKPGEEKKDAHDGTEAEYSGQDIGSSEGADNLVGENIVSTALENKAPSTGDAGEGMNEQPSLSVQPTLESQTPPIVENDGVSAQAVPALTMAPTTTLPPCRGIRERLFGAVRSVQPQPSLKSGGGLIVDNPNNEYIK